jgi:hypothetical protein
MLENSKKYFSEFIIRFPMQLKNKTCPEIFHIYYKGNVESCVEIWLKNLIEVVFEISRSLHSSMIQKNMVQAI